MMLPPKALQVLIDLKKELLQTKDLEPSVMITPKSTPKVSTSTMRHARKPNAYQKMCQRHDWSSPVY